QEPQQKLLEDCDIEGAKSLLQLATSADREAAAYRYSAPLQEQLFEVAFGRLSEELRRRFAASYPYPGQRHLNLLGRLLKDAIIEYSHHRRRKALNISSSPKPRMPPRPPMPHHRKEVGDQLCWFCRQGGHRVEECRVLAGTLC